jgi:fumarate hydratase class I
MLEGTALTGALVELVRRSSTSIPADIQEAIARSADREAAGSGAQTTLRLLLVNVREAEKTARPVCQDTGALLFFVERGPEYSQRAIEQAATEAVREATRRNYLRPNAVDPVTGRNSGDNTGVGVPYMHFEERAAPGLEVRLLQKGGGSENVSRQYTLPDAAIGAQRDLEGVRRCVLDAVHRAQGKGCAPGIIGVGVGGDRGLSYLVAKRQLLRRLDDRSPDPGLAALESRLVEELNTLGIGPMGCGGATTVLAVKAGIAYRVPACYFVSVAYMCWALRRRTMAVSASGEVRYHD